MSPAIGTARLIRDVQEVTAKSADTAWILCPWMARFSRGSEFWLSVLPIHDANDALLSVLRPGKKAHPHVFAAIFANDVLRPTQQLIHRIHDAGLSGVINLPSVSFLDGESGSVLDALSIGIEREIDSLAQFRQAGLRVGGVVRSAAAAARMLQIGAEFLLAHGGPPTSGNEDPAKSVASAVGEITRPKRIPVFAISDILPTTAS